MKIFNGLKKILKKDIVESTVTDSDILEMAEILIPDRVKALDNSINAHSDQEKISHLEAELKRYVENNQDEIIKLKSSLDKISEAIKKGSDINSLKDEIKKIEIIYKTFDRYSENLICDDDWYKLYRTKFNLETFNICKHQKLPIASDNREKYYYERVISEKIRRIISKKNVYVNDLNTFDIIRILKGDNIKCNPNKIQNSLFLLSFLSAFDREDGLKEFFKNFKINKNDINLPTAYKICDIKTEQGFEIEWDDTIPLETIFRLYPKKRFINDPLFSLYQKLNIKEEYSSSYMVPEGITKITVNEYGKTSTDETVMTIIDNLLKDTNNKVIIMPSTLKELNGPLFNQVNVKGFVLNEGLESLGYHALMTQYGFSELNIPSTLLHISKATTDWGRIRVISFDNFMDSRLLKSEYELSFFLKNFCRAKKEGKDEYHFVSERVKQKKRAYLEGRYSTFCDPELFEKDEVISTYEVSTWLDSIVIKYDDSKNNKTVISGESLRNKYKISRDYGYYYPYPLSFYRGKDEGKVKIGDIQINIGEKLKNLVTEATGYQFPKPWESPYVTDEEKIYIKKK